MTLKAVIIDFDDTLVMTELACFVLENEALRRMNRAPMAREAHVANWGVPIHQAIAERSPGISVEDYLPIANTVHQEMVSAGQIDEVSAENMAALDILISRGLQLFIVTSRSEEECQHLLDPNHHLNKKFVHIYHSGNTSHIKPDPRVFDNLFREYSLLPSECIYVGDSPSDGIAANKAGMPFIVCFESELRTPTEFANMNVHASIQQFSELPGTINTLI